MWLFLFPHTYSVLRKCWWCCLTLIQLPVVQLTQCQWRPDTVGAVTVLAWHVVTGPASPHCHLRNDTPPPHTGRKRSVGACVFSRCAIKETNECSRNGVCSRVSVCVHMCVRVCVCQLLWGALPPHINRLTTKLLHQYSNSICFQDFCFSY